MTERALQIFTDKHLQYTKQLTPRQIVDFLEDFRHMAAAGQREKSKLISMKVPESLLRAFKVQARFQGRPYQTLIKDLMRQWLKSISIAKPERRDRLLFSRDGEL